MHNLIGCKIHRFIDPMHQTLSNPIKIWHCTHPAHQGSAPQTHDAGKIMIMKMRRKNGIKDACSTLDMDIFNGCFYLFTFLYLYQIWVNIAAHCQCTDDRHCQTTQWHLQTKASPQVWDDGSWQRVTEVEMVEVALNQRQTSNLFDTGRLLNADGLVTARPDLAAKSRSWSIVWWSELFEPK